MTGRKNGKNGSKQYTNLMCIIHRDCIQLCSFSLDIERLALIGVVCVGVVHAKEATVSVHNC